MYYTTGYKKPYHVGSPIRQPEDYFGHERARQALINAVERGNSMVVVAPPRMGTTSLLNSLCFPDVREHWGDRVTAIVSIDCTDRIRGPLDFLRRLGDLVNKNQTTSQINLQETHLWVLADAILDAISQAPGYWVVLLDNFEALSGFPADFFDHLRACSNNSRPILIAASHIPLEDLDIRTNGGSPFGNNLPLLRLGEWTETELESFLQATSQNSAIDLTPYSQDIQCLAGRVPAFVQHVASQLFDMLHEDRVDLQELAEDTAMNLRDTFEQIWQGRTLRPGERDVLVGVVYGHEQPPGPGLSVTSLVRYGYLNQDKRIASRLFADYLRRSIPRLIIDEGARRVLVAGSQATLPRKDYDLLLHLYKNTGRVCSTEDILEHVWHIQKELQGASEATMVYQRIRALRKVIEENHREPRHILNVPGIGYRFENYAQGS